MARTILAFFMMACVSVVSVAQTPPPLPPGFPPPARDTSAQPATAVIRGHVFDASSGQPLRRAQVRATSPELRENRLAITDANGAYEIKNLAAGRYSLFANKGSFVGLSYGQTRPFEAGTLLDVHSAQLLEKVDFNLPHGAVIMGRVVDEFGEPTADVQVAAMRYQYMQGRRQLVNTGRPATTNDIGEFRIYALPPGQYIISATYRGLVNINDAASDDRSGYAPTCYPGTANVAEAQRMTITVGQKLSDLNIALSPTRMARVAGTAVDSEGKPIANGMLMMIQTSGGGFNMSSGSPIKPDGTFSIGNVAPGDYTLRFMPPAGLGSSPFEVVQADLSVAGEDITDVRLVGMKPPKVSGRIIPPASQTNTTSFSSFQIVAAPLIPQLLAIGGPSRVNDDG
ncbi:MAG TPA: carboxypeptidase-like regulatory domain-containing protein, partial [Vicinamibacterales bacterium]|nr:carboxypeptidase-like regulatory domain-containing protein [Vicinamibacterales bacterium]